MAFNRIHKFVLINFILPTFALLFSTQAFSYWSPDGIFIGVGGGAAWFNLPKSSTTVPNGENIPVPYNVDIYSIDAPDQTPEAFGYIGYRFQNDTPWFPYVDVAVEYTHIFSSHSSGNIQQFSVPEMTNYSYQTNLSASAVLLTAKLDLYNYNCFMPYISAGVGGAETEVSGYKEQALIDVTPRISPEYGNNTNTQLAYTLGAGFDYLIKPNVWISIGYEYAHLGPLQTGSGVSTWSNTSVHLGALNTNSVLGSITYEFPNTM